MTEIQSDIDAGWPVSGDTPLEPTPNYVAALTAEQTRPVVPSALAPPAIASVVDHQPHQLDPYPPQPAAITDATGNITTLVTTATETHTRLRSCCKDTYCPGFIFCFNVPTTCPAGAGGCCNCLPPTTACCEGGFGITCLIHLIRSARSADNPIVIIMMLVLLALMLFAFIGIIAFLIYQLGDDEPPAIAKRYRITALVIAIVGYIILIAVGIALAVVYA